MSTETSEILWFSAAWSHHPSYITYPHPSLTNFYTEDGDSRVLQTIGNHRGVIIRKTTRQIFTAMKTSGLILKLGDEIFRHYRSIRTGTLLTVIFMLHLYQIKNQRHFRQKLKRF
jgi:hypothetical protein